MEDKKVALQNTNDRMEELPEGSEVSLGSEAHCRVVLQQSITHGQEHSEARGHPWAAELGWRMDPIWG